MALRCCTSKMDFIQSWREDELEKQRIMEEPSVLRDISTRFSSTSLAAIATPLPLPLPIPCCCCCWLLWWCSLPATTPAKELQLKPDCASGDCGRSSRWQRALSRSMLPRIRDWKHPCGNFAAEQDRAKRERERRASMGEQQSTGSDNQPVKKKEDR